jgi:hypothetical protein
MAFIVIRVRSEIVSDLIGGFYDAAYEPERWSTSIEALRSVFGGSTACFVREGPNVRLSDAIGANTDIAYQAIYIRDFAQENNSFKEAYSAVAVGETFRPQEKIGADILKGDRFWHEWILPQNMHHGLASKLLVSGPSLWFVDVHRGANSTDFHADDVELFALLTPHIRRAAEMGRNFQTAQAMAATFSNLCRSASSSSTGINVSCGATRQQKTYSAAVAACFAPKLANCR